MNFEKAMKLGYILSHLSELEDVKKVFDTVWFRFITADGPYSVPMDVFTLVVFAIGFVTHVIGLAMVIHWMYVRRREIAGSVYAAFAVMFLGMTSEELMR